MLITYHVPLLKAHYLRGCFAINSLLVLQRLLFQPCPIVLIMVMVRLVPFRLYVQKAIKQAHSNTCYVNGLFTRRINGLLNDNVPALIVVFLIMSVNLSLMYSPLNEMVTLFLYKSLLMRCLKCLVCLLAVSYTI